jgi:hypothetical protein
MESQTFWQALFYLGAFYLTWLIFLASRLIEDVQVVYPFMLVIFILAPKKQSIFNILVYTCPQILK